ncbi:alcohol dehydrogenase catalytic domain-containing protein [[Eubacterium] cellulosolvens]
MTETMKAARLHRIGENLRVDRVEVPKVGPDDVLVDIKATGICHSDLNYRNGVTPVPRLPIILGHEIAGALAKKGDRVKGLKEGDRVCVHYIRSCGKCEFCRKNRENFCVQYEMIGMTTDGGFAEYISVPARSVFKLPQAIPFDQGSITGCAVSTAFHALRRGRQSRGDTVMVNGIGGLGVHVLKLAKILKAGKIIAVDVSDEKLKLAKRLGADETINAATEDPAERMKKMTNGRLADVVVDLVGVGTIEKAIDCVGKGGRMVLVGIGQKEIRISPYKTIIGKEMDLVGVNDHLSTELTELIRLVSSGKLDLSDSVTHRVSLDNINSGFEILEERIGNPIRVVVTQ